MFTGIITQTGKFTGKEDQLFNFRADEKVCKKLSLGASIAVNGVCLTVCKLRAKNSFSVMVMPETIKKTTLGSVQENDLVNLELPVTPEGFLAGHIVQGHVDGTGVIADIGKKGNSRILKIEVSSKLSKYIVEKGSVAINGISLTVIQAEKTYFTTGIIPYTWENTMLQAIKIGDRVNIETDILAKYIDKLI